MTPKKRCLAKPTLVIQRLACDPLFPCGIAAKHHFLHVGSMQNFPVDGEHGGEHMIVCVKGSTSLIASTLHTDFWL